MQDIELSLHERGYKYTGSESLYNLTWIEVFRMVDASVRMADQVAGVRRSDADKFSEYEQRLIANA